MKIGVFDSGVGGQSVANAIKREVLDIEILVVEDKANLPYGTKTPDQLFRLVLPLLKSMQEEGCKVIVVACNSVTTNIIEDLRQNLQVPLIGMEPMVKPAAEQTKSDIIAVCATPVTLQSKRYKGLKQTYAQDVQVLEPDCSDWASLIENTEIDRKHVQQQINSVCENGADVIVLGCTHYHWIEEIVKEVANGRATVLQPEAPVIAQLKRVLEQLS